MGFQIYGTVGPFAIILTSPTDWMSTAGPGTLMSTSIKHGDPGTLQSILPLTGLMVPPMLLTPRTIDTVTDPSPTTVIGPGGHVVGGSGDAAAVTAHSPVSLAVTTSPFGIVSVVSVTRTSSTPNMTVAGVPAGHGVLGPLGVRPKEAKFWQVEKFIVVV